MHLRDSGLSQTGKSLCGRLGRSGRWLEGGKPERGLALWVPQVLVYKVGLNKL